MHIRERQTEHARCVRFPHVKHISPSGRGNSSRTHCKQSSALGPSARGERFPLSPGERAGNGANRTAPRVRLVTGRALVPAGEGAGRQRRRAGALRFLLHGDRFEGVLKLGSSGDAPAPVGDLPTGIGESHVVKKAVLMGSNGCGHSVRRVAGRNRRVACATRNDFSNTLLESANGWITKSGRLYK